MLYREKFTKNLQDLCKNKNISLIAKEIGLNQQTLQRYLHNEMQISLENLCLIADYFGEDLDYLVGRKEY